MITKFLSYVMFNAILLAFNLWHLKQYKNTIILFYNKSDVKLSKRCVIKK